MKRSDKLILTILSVLCLLLLKVETRAQQTGDASGVLMIKRSRSAIAEKPNERIMVWAEGLNEPRCAYTNNDGEFVYAGLQGGRWDIKAVKEGFSQEKEAFVQIATRNSGNEVSPSPVLLEPGAVAPGNAAGRADILIVLYKDEPGEDSIKSTAQASDNPSSFNGTVVDSSSGKPLSSAFITVYGIDPKTKQPTLLTRKPSLSEKGKQGSYSFEVPQLSKYQQYVFSVTRPGYYPATLLLRTSQRSPQTINLRPRDVANEIGPPMVELAEAARRYVYSPLVMTSLPLPGVRTIDAFALLAPGVLPPPATFNIIGPGLTAGIGSAGQFSVNGMRARSNNFTIDGSDNNEEDVGARRQGFVSLVPQSIESIRELQVITALADARFGRNIGGQVNAISASGGPRLHGSIYGFFADKRFKARDFFDRTGDAGSSGFPITRQVDGVPVRLDGQPIVRNNPVREENPFTRIQAGFVLGLPIQRLKGSFFTSWERQAIHTSQESHYATPTVEERGMFNTGATGFKSNDGRFFPASLPGSAIFSLYPFPNDPAGPYGLNTYTSVLPADGEGRLFSIRFDNSFNAVGAANTFMTRFNRTDDSRIIPVVGGAIFSSLRPKVGIQNVAFDLTSSFSNVTSNTVRVSHGRTTMRFSEVRDAFLSSSAFFPQTPFLLNAPLILNTTLPNAGGVLGPVTYTSATSPAGAALLDSIGLGSVTSTEEITGPLGQVMIAGFSPVGVDVFNFPQSRATNTFQLADTLTRIQGRNIFTMGFDNRHMQINSTVDRNYRPLAVFSGLNSATDFAIPIRGAEGGPVDGARVVTGLTLAAAGAPTGLFQTLAVVPDSTVGLRFNQFNFFFQDDIRLRPNLRITLGLRYEVNTVPATAGSRLESAFDRARIIKLAQEAIAPCPVRCATLPNAVKEAFPENFGVTFGADRDDWNPRVGFAWDPTGNKHTVVRGGFGVYSDPFPGTVINQSRNAFPSFIPLNTSNFAARSGSKSFLFNLANPNLRQLNQLLNIIAPGTLNTFALKNPFAPFGQPLFNLDYLSLEETRPVLAIVLPISKLKDAYAMQYGLAVEHEFAKDYLWSVSYVGTRGVKLLRVSTPNLGLGRGHIEFKSVEPLSDSTNFPFFKGRMAPAQPLIASLFAISRTFFESSASSTYNSLQTEVRKRLRRGLQFSSALTYSHTIDDASDFFDNAGAFALPQSSPRGSERASANFDARVRAIVSVIWDIPFFKNDRWRGDWQLSSIFTTQTGQPFTINSAVDVNRDGNLTDRLNSTTGLAKGPNAHRQLQIAPGTNPSDLLAPDGLDGLVGRNTFRAPGMLTLDVAATKIIRFGDRYSASFRTEAFNVFNRTHFGIPVRILESPGFGNSVSTTVPARTVQFVLKCSF
ncbi:MAG: TonB-dependent receptor [Acidobacteriota bacterium]